MKWTGLNELREKFLAFFESKGHYRQESFSLIPQNDPSLLLINSGMAPLKPFFTGQQTPPSLRMTTCQKCMRTPDIERVGKTARHGTYFEMLGNFSFGDYFKREATAWAWEFVTGCLEMPADRLWISIYQDDDEAFDIWTKEVGIPPERIVRLGKADNFWEHGTGPCGPCSEIYFDRGEAAGCGSPDCAVGCDCDRYVEFWNLVFTQFDSDGKGNYSPLEHKNIDTGMGLERLACVMQGVGSLFEVDTVANIMKHVSDIAGVKYGDDPKSDVALRVITDHVRSVTFMACDGVLPSNEGRGYVMRRLLRRAVRFGRLLGVKDKFLYKVSRTVVEENRSAYPALAQRADYIEKLIFAEEERFDKTIGAGLELLLSMVTEVKARGEGVLSGADAFRLYDTYGFPVDLMDEILIENSITLDRDSFDSLMAEQKKRARAARLAMGGEAWSGEDMSAAAGLKTEFSGYDELESDAHITFILTSEGSTNSLDEGTKATIILDKTPFYGESGGQVGDTGRIYNESGVFLVENTTKTPDGKFLHVGVLENGQLDLNASVTAEVNKERRAAIARAHSATHLIHRALRNVLGEGAHQAGSYVEPDSLRFDFAHFSALTPEELARVEAEVNAMALSGLPVQTKVGSMEDAREMGATALFGEKYGDSVRIVKMGDYSVELCGGTHLKNTAMAGIIKITSESSVAAGVRRIEAVTGSKVLDILAERDALINETAKTLKTSPREIARKAAQSMEETRTLTREVDRLTSESLSGLVKDAADKAIDVSGVQLYTARMDGVKADNLRKLGDSLRDKYPNMAALLIAVNDGKVNITAACGKEAVAKGAHAGKIAKEAAQVTGGNGGGRPDGASAGGSDVSKVDLALQNARDVLSGMVK